MPSLTIERKMARRERDRVRRRRDFLDAAERVFARRGYEGAGMEEIPPGPEFERRLARVDAFQSALLERILQP